jgi:hypothetical protein
MENIYSKLRNLAKSVRAQNLFVAVKELHGVQLFRNNFDFSKLQEIYLSFLYMYDTINRDIIVDKISEKVLDCELYEDAYMTWRRGNSKKSIQKDDKKKDVNLVVGKNIKFPKTGV